MNTARERLHRLTHKHYSAARPGVGEIHSCGWRLTPWMDVYFHPDGYAADWLQVPYGEKVLQALLATTTVEEAVALIDEAGRV